MRRCRDFPPSVGVAFLSGDTYSNSSPSLRRGVLITANTGLAAGGCATATGSQGSNDGGQRPRAPRRDVCWW